MFIYSFTSMVVFVIIIFLVFSISFFVMLDKYTKGLFKKDDSNIDDTNDDENHF